jgi:putative peptide zinc metalloprotease protein
VIYIGIASLVYHFFVKLPGIFLFIVELWWFIALPIYREIKVWASKRHVIMKQSISRQRSAWSVVGPIAALSVLLVPWPGKISVSGLLSPSEVWPVMLASGAMIAEFPYHNGDRVQQGQLIAQFYSPELDIRLQVAEMRAESVRWMATNSGLDASARNQLLVAQQDCLTALAEVSSVRESNATL